MDNLPEDINEAPAPVTPLVAGALDRLKNLVEDAKTAAEQAKQGRPVPGGDAPKTIINAKTGIEKAVEPVNLNKGLPSLDKYVPGKTQPRDEAGKFRDVLARLKQDLGPNGNQVVLAKIKEAEKFGNVGNYKQAVQSAHDLIGTVDRLDSGALNSKSVENVRATTTELGKVISNLPLPFDDQAQKVRFSDLPPVLRELTQNIIDRVEKKIGPKDGAVATKDLKNFMSGGEVYSQSQISSQLNRMLRLLT
jgi:hypothetical protein